jgi:hypothetical protein
MEGPSARCRPSLAPWLLASAIFALLGGCAGSETGNAYVPGLAQITLALQAEDTPPGTPIVAAEKDDTPLRIETAYASVRDVGLDLPAGMTCASLEPAQLVAPARCDVDKVVIDGPFFVDLVTGESTPSLDAIALPPLTYGRIDVRLHRADDGAVPPGFPLDGLTLAATGTYDPDGSNLPFSMELDFNEDARFERPGGFAVTADGTSAIFLWLDVTQWFAGLPIEECRADGELPVTGGVLQITDSGDKCSDIEGELKDAIKESGQVD